MEYLSGKCFKSNKRYILRRMNHLSKFENYKIWQINEINISLTSYHVIDGAPGPVRFSVSNHHHYISSAVFQQKEIEHFPSRRSLQNIQRKQRGSGLRTLDLRTQYFDTGEDYLKITDFLCFSGNNPLLWWCNLFYGFGLMSGDFNLNW